MTALSPADRALLAAIEARDRSLPDPIVWEVFRNGGAMRDRRELLRIIRALEADRARTEAELRLAIDKLSTVAVEWAPAHSAPYVSRDVVQAVIAGVCCRLAQDADDDAAAARFLERPIGSGLG